MNKMHWALTTAVLTGSLFGCAAPNPAGPGRDFDDAQVSQIQKHVTSKDDVRQAFGEPVAKSTSEGTDVWTYRYASAAVNKNLTIMFTGDRVQDYTFKK